MFRRTAASVVGMPLGKVVLLKSPCRSGGTFLKARSFSSWQWAHRTWYRCFPSASSGVSCEAEWQPASPIPRLSAIPAQRYAPRTANLATPKLRLHFLRELPAHVVPVNNLKERLNIIGALVLVLQVVGVLPHIHAKNGLVPCAQWAVLIGRCFNSQGPVRQLEEPGPTAAKNAHRRRSQLVLKSGKRTELRVNSLRQLAGGRFTAFAKCRPPERVVRMASPLIPHRSTGRFGPAVQICNQFLHGLAVQLQVRGHSHIQIVHVRLMMLIVMQMHGYGIEAGLKRVIGVGQSGERERPGWGRRRSCGSGLEAREALRN